MACRSLAILLLALAALGAAAPARADDAWRLVERNGAVDAVDAGALPITLTKGAALKEGTVILTGSDGQAVLQHLDETIIVHASTRVVLTQPEDGKTRVEQTSGVASYSVGKRRSPHFIVETPWLAATVRGTSFLISVNEETAQVNVREGLVEVATSLGDAVTLVSAGATALVSAMSPSRIALTDQTGFSRQVARHETSWRKQAELESGRKSGKSQITWRKSASQSVASAPGLRQTIDLSGVSLPARSRGNWAIVDPGSSSLGVSFTSSRDTGVAAPPSGTLEYGTTGSQVLSNGPLFKWKWKRGKNEGPPWNAIAACAGVMALFMLLIHIRNTRRLRRGGLTAPVYRPRQEAAKPREVKPVTRGSRQRIY